MLFDFYEALLTEKQRTFFKYYFHDDYSLGEIAAEFEVSRQAVYEHIKRADSMLEGYEAKLGLLAKHEATAKWLRELEICASSAGTEAFARKLSEIAQGLRDLEAIGFRAEPESDISK
ncbi:YlxM family DNA-binding protein [Paenibacillus spongiae]|uniref:UPF0122 protein L1F29_11870 n=1 Tax=Paenibacillus spongiae TaxID=2909671 RepID=A0ABY5SM29_9BACL|nr:YlxM family DNA-binding protein [Paenibacillus spongiae]